MLFLAQRFYNNIAVNELIGIKKYETDRPTLINTRIMLAMEHVSDRVVLRNLGLVTYPINCVLFFM